MFQCFLFEPGDKKNRIKKNLPPYFKYVAVVSEGIINKVLKYTFLHRSTALSSSTSTMRTRSFRNILTSTFSLWSNSNTTSRWRVSKKCFSFALPGCREEVAFPRLAAAWMWHRVLWTFREGLLWVDINWMDNGECLDLIEKVRAEGLTSQRGLLSAEVPPLLNVVENLRKFPLMLTS